MKNMIKFEVEVEKESSYSLFPLFITEKQLQTFWLLALYFSITSVKGKVILRTTTKQS